MAENTIKTRIQLKSDTEANWKKAVLPTDNPAGEKTTGASFKPKQGEVIIFSSDSTHPFSRLKIGDGITDVLSLPFIDSNTTNGFYLVDGTSMLPGVGQENINYIDVASDTIYQWETNQYIAKYGFIKRTLSDFFTFNAGTMTNLLVDDDSATLIVNNGTIPSLTIDNISIVTGKGSLI